MRAPQSVLAFGTCFVLVMSLFLAHQASVIGQGCNDQVLQSSICPAPWNPPSGTCDCDGDVEICGTWEYDVCEYNCTTDLVGGNCCFTRNERSFEVSSQCDDCEPTGKECVCVSFSWNGGVESTNYSENCGTGDCPETEFDVTALVTSFNVAYCSGYGP